MNKIRDYLNKNYYKIFALVTLATSILWRIQHINDSIISEYIFYSFCGLFLAMVLVFFIIGIVQWLMDTPVIYILIGFTILVTIGVTFYILEWIV